MLLSLWGIYLIFYLLKGRGLYVINLKQPGQKYFAWVLPPCSNCPYRSLVKGAIIFYYPVVTATIQGSDLTSDLQKLLMFVFFFVCVCVCVWVFCFEELGYWGAACLFQTPGALGVGMFWVTYDM